MDRRFLIISFENSSKKISFTEDLTFIGITDIIKERFQLKSAVVQYYDTDVDDFVDFEQSSIEDIKDYKVIKIRVTNGIRHQPDNDSDLPLMQLVTGDESDHEKLPSQPETPTHSSNSRPETPTSVNSTHSRPETPASVNNTHSRPETPASVNSTHSRPETPVPSTSSHPNTPSSVLQTQTKTGSRKPWPRNYKIPKDDIPRAVRDNLDGKKELTVRDRRFLLDAIYNDATQYDGGLYPTSDMYETIVDSLVREYPYLMAVGDLPAKSAREFWKDKLVFKFGNARKRLDKNHPDVMKRKKIIAQPTTSSQTDEPTSFTWGLACFLPDKPITEDDTSQKLHVDWLRREYKKSGTDIDINGIDLKMDLTFSFRRKRIVTEKVPIKDILEMYPYLQSRQEIVKEFKRLKPNTLTDDIEELLGTGMKKYRKAIISLMKGKKKPNFLTEMEETRNFYRIKNQRDCADDCIAVIGLLVLLKEKPEKVLQFGTATDARNQDSAVQIVVKEKLLSEDDNVFEVLIEDITIFECDNFFEAFSGLVCCIYVFNLAYPKPWEKFFTFIQNVVLGLKDNEGQVNLDRRILSVLSQINSELSKCN